MHDDNRGTDRAEPLLSVDELARRLGRPVTGLDRDRAATVLADVSALVRADGDPAWTPADVPPVVVAVVADVARRAYLNPHQVRAESIGGYSVTYGPAPTIGAWLTPAQRRTVRLAAGRPVDSTTVPVPHAHPVPGTWCASVAGTTEQLPWYTTTPAPARPARP